jgi:ABC-2 type transport system permease protein
MSSRAQVLAPYAEFSRIGFVNILAFRLRYYAGIFTYLINVTVYYFIWTAIYRAAGNGVTSGGAAANIGGYDLGQILTYVAVGWIIRSLYWNTIDQEMAYEVIEGKIAMDFIKPVSIQWMWICRALGETAFRLIMLTALTSVAVVLLFPVHLPASWANFGMFVVSVIGSILLMAAINFMIGTCAIPLTSILALIRAKYWLIELLSGLLIPMTYFPAALQRVAAWLPFEHIAFTPLQIYLGKLNGAAALKALAVQWIWIVALLWLGNLWWRTATRKITIHGG